MIDFDADVIKTSVRHHVLLCFAILFETGWIRNRMGAACGASPVPPWIMSVLFKSIVEEFTDFRCCWGSMCLCQLLCSALVR